MSIKSLGTLRYPLVEVSSFDGDTGTVELTLTDPKHKLTVEMSTGCVQAMMRLIHEVVGKQRTYAAHEWNRYLQLKKLTGFVPPEGEA